MYLLALSPSRKIVLPHSRLTPCSHVHSHTARGLDALHCSPLDGNDNDLIVDVISLSLHRIVHAFIVERQDFPFKPPSTRQGFSELVTTNCVIFDFCCKAHALSAMADALNLPEYVDRTPFTSTQRPTVSLCKVPKFANSRTLLGISKIFASNFKFCLAGTLVLWYFAQASSR